MEIKIRNNQNIYRSSLKPQNVQRNGYFSNNSLKNDAFVKNNMAFTSRCDFSKVVKTLPQLIPAAKDAKYFSKSGKYPLLARYVPQSHFSIVKYTGKETERYLITTGCFPCSKLTLYDPSTKTGILFHLDNDKKTLNSADIIKARLIAKGIDFKNLQLRHIQGEHEIPLKNADAVHEFMKNLGLEPGQLIEEDVLYNAQRKDGIIMDLKNGQTYEFESPWDFLGEFEDKEFVNDYIGKNKQGFMVQELKKIKKESVIMRIGDSCVHFRNLVNNKFFVEVK